MKSVKPINVLAFRGEHGTSEPGKALQSRLGSISFGTLAAATLYARSPNNHNDVPVEPRIIAAQLNIERPLMNDSSDPFIDLSIIASVLGPQRARTVAMALSQQIKGTNNWEEICQDENLFEAGKEGDLAWFLDNCPDALDRLYVEAYHFFDNPIWVGWLKEAGYDGACIGGIGETAGEAEYRIFSEDQAHIKLSAPLKMWTDLPMPHDEGRSLAI